VNYVWAAASVVAAAFSTSFFFETDGIDAYEATSGYFPINQFYLNENISENNDLDIFDFNTGFYTNQFYLNGNISEKTDIDFDEDFKLFSIDQINIQLNNKETNLDEVYDSCVIFSGANFHNTIRTGITGAT
jgi:hypothetical protein